MLMKITIILIATIINNNNNNKISIQVNGEKN